MLGRNYDTAKDNLLNGGLLAIGITFGVIMVVLWFILGPFFKSRAFAVSDFGIHYKQGSYAKRQVDVPWQSIEKIAVKASPVDRMLGLASVRITYVGAARPIDLGYLGTEQAQNLERNIVDTLGQLYSGVQPQIGAIIEDPTRKPYGMP